MADQQPDVAELQVGKEGLSLKSASLNTLLTLFTALGVAALGVAFYGHVGDSKAANDTMVSVMKELTQAQRESTAVAREQNCLIAMPIDKRDPDLCRRVSGAPR